MAGKSRMAVRVHGQREEAIATPSTHVVPLSACDKDMVQQCDEAHKQAELNFLKRKRKLHPETNLHQKLHPETNLHQSARKMPPCTPPSEHLSSEDISSELEELELGHTELPTLQSNPVQEREEGGRIDQSKADGREKPFHSGLSSVAEPRADGGKLGESLVNTRSNGASPYPTSSTFVAPRVRLLGPVNRTIQSPDLRPPSSAAAQCPSRTGSFGELSSLSLSGQSVRRTTTETPPGVANAFEAHEMRVRCLAPKRPKAHTMQRRLRGRHHDAPPLALSFADVAYQSRI